MSDRSVRLRLEEDRGELRWMTLGRKGRPSTLYGAIPSVLAKELRGFQCDAIEKLLRHRRFILAHTMGAGKTRSCSGAIAALLNAASLRNDAVSDADDTRRELHTWLVFVPKNIQMDWLREIREHWECRNTSVIVLSDVNKFSEWWKTPSTGHRICIANPEAMTSSSGVIAKCLKQVHSEGSKQTVVGLVIDEAHNYVGNEDTSLFQAFSKTLTMVPSAHCWLLTGTPIKNDIKTLESLCSVLQIREKLPPGPLLRPAELQQRDMDDRAVCKRMSVIRDICTHEGFMHFVTQEDIDREEKLPELKEYVVTLNSSKPTEVTSCSKPDLKRVASEQHRIRNCMTEAMVFIALHHIRMYNHKVLILLSIVEHAKVMVDYFDRIFAQIDLNGHVELLTGEDGMPERMRKVERFRMDPTCFVFIGTDRICSVGMNLSFANVLIMPTKFSQDQQKQAIARIRRPSKCLRDDVSVYTIIVDDVMKCVDTTRQQAENVYDYFFNQAGKKVIRDPCDPSTFAPTSKLLSYLRDREKEDDECELSLNVERVWTQLTPLSREERADAWNAYYVDCALTLGQYGQPWVEDEQIVISVPPCEDVSVGILFRDAENEGEANLMFVMHPSEAVWSCRGTERFLLFSLRIPEVLPPWFQVSIRLFLSSLQQVQQARYRVKWSVPLMRGCSTGRRNDACQISSIPPASKQTHEKREACRKAIASGVHFTRYSTINDLRSALNLVDVFGEDNDDLGEDEAIVPRTKKREPPRSKKLVDGGGKKGRSTKDDATQSSMMMLPVCRAPRSTSSSSFQSDVSGGLTLASISIAERQKQAQLLGMLLGVAEKPQETNDDDDSKATDLLIQEMLAHN